MAVLANCWGVTATSAQTPEPQGEPTQSTSSISPLPIATAARFAGDSKQTRFILDLDGKVPLRAFAIGNPQRVVIDVPQLDFRIGEDVAPRGLVKAFRYGLVMPGASRIVFDLAKSARIKNAEVIDAASGQPARLIVDLESISEAEFAKSLAQQAKPDASAAKPVLRPAIESTAPIGAVAASGADGDKAAGSVDRQLVVVIDPGHGGIDKGTEAGGVPEKEIVLAFSLALRDKLDAMGKYRVVMTRDDDTFVPLGERTKAAREANAALFLSIHADALPRGEGDARGATIYTLSDRASDTEAQRLANSENRADAIGGVDLTEEPAEVADILIDLTQRETKVFSNQFAQALMGEMKSTVRMHKHPLRSAGFKVLKAPDVPSVLIELGYVSNKADMELLQSEAWRVKAVASVAKAVNSFLAKRLISAATVD